MRGRTLISGVAALSAVALLLVGLAAASPAAAAESFLSGFVTNEETPALTKFDTTTDEVDTGYENSPGGEPGAIAITADGTKAFIGESCDLLGGNEGFLTRASTEGSAFAKIRIAPEGCVSKIAISPKADLGQRGETVWAVNGNAAIPVDSSDESIGQAVVLPVPCPSGCIGEQVIQSINDVAVSPDGNTLYLLYTEETIQQGTEEILETYIDKIATYSVGGQTAVPLGEPVGVDASTGRSIAINAAGDKAFVTSSQCSLHQVCVNGLATFDLEPQPVFAESQTFDLTEAGQILITPDERLALVAQDPGTFFKGESIEAFELDTGPPYEDFYFREFDENDPIAMALTPDGKDLYVGFHDRSMIEAIELDGPGEKSIPAGEGPVEGIAVTPAQAPQARLQVHPGRAGEPSQFDASESSIECNSAQCSEIAEYKWAFGDGAEETTTVPTTTHTYGTPGPFTASVTEVSSYGVSTEATYDGHQTLKAGGPGARAQATVTLPTLPTQASAATRLGGTISDTATLAGGEGDGGSIEFQLFGPDAPSCEGAPLETFVAPVSGDGDYTSGDYTTTEIGTYHWTASYTDAAADPPALGRCGDAEESVEVAKAQPTISGQASAGVVIGGVVTDRATVSGAAPTGTVTFALHAPGDLDCTGTPVYTDSVNVNEDPLEPGIAFSGRYSPTRAGKYRWVASYSGDADNEAVTSACNAPSQSVSIGKATPTIATQASPAVRVPEGQIFDVATVSGGHEASGSVSFALYGPGDPTCARSPLFTDLAELGADGVATSPVYAPAKVGEYRWVATYGGDGNNVRVAGRCGAPNESVTAMKAIPGFETRAVERVTIGDPISDTAILSGSLSPTGTIDFALYGPDDDSCTGAPLATDTVTVGGKGSFASAPFTPSSPGTYRWVAAYSGDAQNEPVEGRCGEEGETSVVARSTPTVSTTATGQIDLGGQIEARADVTGAPQPTGTVTFTLFAPGDADCVGAPLYTATVPLGTDGSAASGPFTPIAAGTYAWRASYSGDTDNDAVTGACGPVSAVDAPPPPPGDGSPPSSGGSPPPPPSPPPPSKSLEADLRVKLDGPDSGRVGQRLTYRVDLVNLGGAQSGPVELTSRLSGVRLQVGTAKGSHCKGGDHLVSCKLPALAPGEKATVKITVLPKAAGRLKLTSTVAAAGADSAPGDNRAAASIPIARAARR